MSRLSEIGFWRVAVVFGAILQVAVPAIGTPLGLNVGRVSDQNPTLVTPAGYAFAIWTPIFLLCFVYAVYQVLPSKRDDAFLGRIAPFAALTFLANSVWEVLFPLRLFVPAQVLFAFIFAFAVIAHLLVQRRYDPQNRAHRWLAAPTFGLLSGWVTAAFLVGFATTFSGIGELRTGFGAALVGAGLLLLGGAVSTAVILAARGGPVAGYGAYAVAVLWALVAVVVGQYDASLLTTAAAVVAAVPVVIVLVDTGRRSGTRPTGRSPRPRVV
ncbi:MAG: hypothetical protein ACFB50_02740 [Rubrobacteraceae bacterium]